MYKEASQLKLRFATPRGVLTLEQLWTISMRDLAASIKVVKEELDKETSTDGLDFLEDTKTETSSSKVLTLSFNILKDVYLTRKDELSAAKTAAENKAHNEKILEKIYAKQENALDNLSEEELRAMLK